jgi:hypothetical protein
MRGVHAQVRKLNDSGAHDVYREEGKLREKGVITVKKYLVALFWLNYHIKYLITRGVRQGW